MNYFVEVCGLCDAGVELSLHDAIEDLSCRFEFQVSRSENRREEVVRQITERLAAFNGTCNSVRLSNMHTIEELKKVSSKITMESSL